MKTNYRGDLASTQPIPSLVVPSGTPMDTSAPRPYGGSKTSDKPAPNVGEIAAGNPGLRDPNADPGSRVPGSFNVPAAPSLSKPPLAGIVDVSAGKENIPGPTSATPAPRPTPDASLNPAVAPPFAKTSLL
jgi:hypothetical protein